MKSLRMSRSTENRNAAKAMSFRGGVRRGAFGLPEGQQIVSGRRMRRAQRSRSSRLQPFVVQDDGSLGRPIATDDVDTYLRGVLDVRVT